MPVTLIDCAPDDLSINIEPAIAENPSASHHDLETRWSELRAANPRLYNGPILAFKDFDVSTNTITCDRADFMHLAVSAAYPDNGFTPVTILSVTGVLTATTNDAQRCVCVAKRARNTRVYGGQWELAPSGGLDVPNDLNTTDPNRVDGEIAANSLKTELAEELGICAHEEIDWARSRVVGLVLDEQARSLDIMFHVEHRRKAELGSWPWSPDQKPRNWEYDEIRWESINSIEVFVRTEPCIPPMVDVVQAKLLN